MDQYRRWAIWEPEYMDGGTTPWYYPGAVTLYNPRFGGFVYQHDTGSIGLHTGKPNDDNYMFYIDYAYEWDTNGV